MPSQLEIPPLTQPLVDGETGLISRAWLPWFSQLEKLVRGNNERWTTANRPTADLFIGRYGYNSDRYIVEFWDGTGWISQPAAGVVDYHGKDSPQKGWLECDGSAVSRTAYAALFAEIGTVHGAGDGSTTFNVPDLRGEFIRGWDHGRGVDTGRVFGSTQLDAMQGHRHPQWSNGAWATTLNPVDVSNMVVTGNTDGTTSLSTYGATVTDGSYGTPRTAAETRGRNVALLPIIKT